MRQHTYPFGRPVTPRPPSADGPRALFVLGAYPSALHVRWTPPAPHRRIQAIPVDDEPTPFWDGADQAARVAAWRAAVGWDDRWGRVDPVGHLNGPSGAWVDANVLRPLGSARADAWITDCLDTYHASAGVAARLADTYAPFAAAAGLPDAVLPAHPSETDIVRGADRARLLDELRRCRPSLVVTLGNAALRVLRALAEDGESALPSKLAPSAYAHPVSIRHGGVTMRVLPLAHPAAPPAYQQAHAAWVAARLPAPPEPPQ